MLRKIVKKSLPERKYFKKEYKKRQIVLHHTEASTVTSTYNWWKSQDGHICTAYMVDKDGTIYECFDPKYWAYHTGTGKQYDKHSIGIELINEGVLTKTGDVYKYLNNRYKYKGIPCTTITPWRGYSYFATYSTEQIEAIIDLINYLYSRFYDIEKNVVINGDYDPSYKLFSGIIRHCNIKESKTDLSPAFPMEKIQENFNEIKKLQEDYYLNGHEGAISILPTPTSNQKGTIIDFILNFIKSLIGGTK